MRVSMKWVTIPMRYIRTILQLTLGNSKLNNQKFSISLTNKSLGTSYNNNT